MLSHAISPTATHYSIEPCLRTRTNARWSSIAFAAAAALRKRTPRRAASCSGARHVQPARVKRGVVQDPPRLPAHATRNTRRRQRPRSLCGTRCSSSAPPRSPKPPTSLVSASFQLESPLPRAGRRFPRRCGRAKQASQCWRTFHSRGRCWTLGLCLRTWRSRTYSTMRGSPRSLQ